MKSILLVEDETLVRRYLTIMLPKLCPDISISEATDGQDALNKLHENDFEIMLVDINMPVMNGFDLIKMVREDEKFNNLSIIVLSSNGCEKLIEYTKSLGISAYICKLDATEATAHNPLVAAINMIAVN